MKALITGAGGFVAPYLRKAVSDDLNCEITFTGRAGGKHDKGNHEFREADILDPVALLSLLQDEHPHYIFHLAAQSSVARSWKDPAETVNVNIKGALCLLDAVRALDYSPRVIMVGSGEEYGHIKPDDVPIKEGQFLRPGNIYAATKAGQNMMAYVYAKAYDMDVIMTRSFNHMGPGQKPVFVASDFCRQAVRIEKGFQDNVIRVGNLEAKRDFTDVRDVVKAYTALAQFGIPGETYNVGRGEPTAIKDLLSMITDLSTADIKVEVDEKKLRPIDIPEIYPDVSKIYAATGWKAHIPVKQTLLDMLEYYRNNPEILSDEG